MLDQIYGWIQNLVVYLIVMSAVMHVIPGKDYGKYIRFFAGLVLILLVFSPLLKITGMEDAFLGIYQNKEYEREREEIRQAAQMYEESGFEDLIREAGISGTEDSEGTSDNKEDSEWIKVEDIKIGK